MCGLASPRTDTGAQGLADALALHPALTSLSLHRNRIGDVGLARLADMLAACPPPEVFCRSSLIEMNEFFRVVSAVTRFLSCCFWQLTYLDIRFNEYSSAGVSFLSRRLEYNEHLTALDLHASTRAPERAAVERILQVRARVNPVLQFS